MVLDPRQRLLAAAVAALFVVGVGLAVAKPGNLEDDDDASASATTSTTEEPSGSITDPSNPPSTADTSTTETTGATATTATTSAPSGGDGGSGLGSGGAGEVDDDGLANTGGPLLVVPGFGILAAAGVADRLRRRSS